MVKYKITFSTHEGTLYDTFVNVQGENLKVESIERNREGRISTKGDAINEKSILVKRLKAEIIYK
jgi:hypothetical protein